MTAAIFGIDTGIGGNVTVITPAVAAGKQFALVKATQDDFEDAGFKKTLAAVKATVMVPGSFHFLIHSLKVKGVPLDASISPVAQANKYLDTVNLRNGSYGNHLFSLDVENFHRTKTVGTKKVVIYRSIPDLQDVDQWIERFRSRLPDAYLLLYVNPAVWASFGNPKITQRYDSKVKLWLASWTGSADFALRLGGQTPTIHQYGAATIGGHKVDGDASSLTVSQLKKIANWTTAVEDLPADPADGENEIGCQVSLNGVEETLVPVLSIGDGIASNTVAAVLTYNDASHTYDDAALTYDSPGSGGYNAIFGITVAPVNPLAAVEMDYTTVNGSAIAGIDYVAQSGHLIIPLGVATASLSVTLLSPVGFSGDRTFTIVLSNPVNVTLDDATGSMTLHYGAPPTDAADLDHFSGWPREITVYNQFVDCVDRNACTAFSVAAATSCQEWRDSGVKTRFNAPKLFKDAGGFVCTKCLDSCPGFAIATTTLRAQDVGVQVLYGTRFRRIQGRKTITGSSKGDLIKKLKRAIYANGCVVTEQIWYTYGRHGNTGITDWNSSGIARPGIKGPDYIMPDPGNDKSMGGHSVILVGWDNDIKGTGIGGFLVQSSQGTGWGKNGRAWLRYETLTTRQVRDGTPSSPWFHFRAVVMKPGG